MPDSVADRLEPAAREMIGEACPDYLVALASLAISAARIADAIEAVTSYHFNEPAIRTRKE